MKIACRANTPQQPGYTEGAGAAIPGRSEAEDQQLLASTGLRLQPAPLLRAEHI